ncbi:siphovirus Gp157 family protein [Terrisporobacter vanillatitrophus]|uniref:siphovirus Gp157 family protein n=1 Tax=Terrisporobacter vanillatitrophus TaxID=3058402 RepID=UPI00336942AC
MTSLYQLTSNFLEVDNLIEEYLQAGEEDLAENLVKANQIIAKEIENKSVGFIYAFRNMDSQVDAIDAEIKRLQDLKKQVKAKDDRLKTMLKSSMEALGTTKIETDLGKISIRNNPGSLKIDDMDLIPNIYKEEVVTTTVKVDSNLIKKQIKAGIGIEGCHIEAGTSLIVPKAKK